MNTNEEYLCHRAWVVQCCRQHRGGNWPYKRRGEAWTGARWHLFLLLHTKTTLASQRALRLRVTFHCNPRIVTSVQQLYFLLWKKNQSRWWREILLSLGIDINSKDDLGQTALHRATRRKQKGVLETLLENATDVDCKNDNN